MKLSICSLPELVIFSWLSSPSAAPRKRENISDYNGIIAEKSSRWSIDQP
jgi:hypothetical protein